MDMGDSLARPVTLACSHSFCGTCWSEWMVTTHANASSSATCVECPICLNSSVYCPIFEWMFHREKSNHESVLLMQQQFELDMPIEWRKEASTGHARESDSRFWFFRNWPTTHLRDIMLCRGHTIGSWAPSDSHTRTILHRPWTPSQKLEYYANLVNYGNSVWD